MTCTAALETLRRASSHGAAHPNEAKPGQAILTTSWQPNSTAGIFSQMADDGVEHNRSYHMDLRNYQEPGPACVVGNRGRVLGGGEFHQTLETLLAWEQVYLDHITDHACSA